MPVPQPHAEPEAAPGAGACAERARRDVDAVRDRQPRRAPAPAPARRGPGEGQAEDRRGALAGGLGQHRLTRGARQALRGPRPPDGHGRGSATSTSPRCTRRTASRVRCVGSPRTSNGGTFFGQDLRARGARTRGSRRRRRRSRRPASRTRHSARYGRSMRAPRPATALEQPHRRPRDRHRRGRPTRGCSTRTIAWRSSALTRRWTSPPTIPAAAKGHDSYEASVVVSERFQDRYSAGGHGPSGCGGDR